jgi:hypothetical protein
MPTDDNSYDYQQYMIKLAESNVLDGVTNEPRAFFDTITTTLPFVEVNGHAECFRNGEDFPIRITHCLLALKRLRVDINQSPIDPEILLPVDPRVIQRAGVRLKFHDQYYMNKYASNPILGAPGGPLPRQVFVAAPAWSMNPSAAADIISHGNSAWQFQRPFILSVRDTLRVDLQLDQTPDPTEQAFLATVSFTGKGVMTNEPRFFSGQLLMFNGLRFTLDTEGFKNDGSEPVMITNMSVNISGALSDPDPTGDISRLSIGVRQIGNGTNASWFSGPVNTPDIVPDMIPAVLLGQQSGRAIVHRFPGNGLIWEPGEGITAEAQNLFSNDTGFGVHIGLLGYISVQ